MGGGRRGCVMGGRRGGGHFIIGRNGGKGYALLERGRGGVWHGKEE